MPRKRSRVGNNFIDSKEIENVFFFFPTYRQSNNCVRRRHAREISTVESSLVLATGNRNSINADLNSTRYIKLSVDARLQKKKSVRLPDKYS